MICKNCKKEIVNEPIKTEPSRHCCSPNSINWMASNEEEKYYDYFCSRECEKIHKDENYALWAELDRNVSDSECFESSGWLGIYRVGKCKITGKIVKVEPLMPSNNSGQPKECTEHFILRKKYQDIIQ